MGMYAYITKPSPHQVKANGATHEIIIERENLDEHIMAKRAVARVLRRAKKFDVRANKWQQRVILKVAIDRGDLAYWLYANFPELKTPTGRACTCLHGRKVNDRCRDCDSPEQP